MKYSQPSINSNCSKHWTYRNLMERARSMSFPGCAALSSSLDSLLRRDPSDRREAGPRARSRSLLVPQINLLVWWLGLHYGSRSGAESVTPLCLWPRVPLKRIWASSVPNQNKLDNCLLKENCSQLSRYLQPENKLSSSKSLDTHN